MSHCELLKSARRGSARRARATPTATLLLTLGLGLAASLAHASQPSAVTAQALERISTIRPCAAAALLHVMRKADDASSGTFYLVEFPTPSIISFLLGVEDGGTDFQLQPNLYAEVNYYIEVRWSLEKLNEKVVMLSTEAQLVSRAGVKLTPPHPIEPPTRVLMVGQSLRLLPTAAVD
jgi:hypothetical protein